VGARAYVHACVRAYVRACVFVSVKVCCVGWVSCIVYICNTYYPIRPIRYRRVAYRTYRVICITYVNVAIYEYKCMSLTRVHNRTLSRC